MWLILTICFAFLSGHTGAHHTGGHHARAHHARAHRTGSHHGCDRDTPSQNFEVCKPDKIPTSFPGSEEELDTLCDAARNYIECAMDVQRRCQFEPRDTIEVLQQKLVPLNKVCDKDSQLHRDIVGNLECLKGFVDDRLGRSCFGSPSEELIEKHERELIEQGVIKSDDLSKRFCLKNVHLSACWLQKLEANCGEGITDALVELVRKTPIAFVTKDCGEEAETLLPTAVRLYRLEKVIDNELKENTEAGDVCKRPINKTCVRNEDFPFFPGSPEEYEQACKLEIDYLECFIRTEEMCQFEPEELPSLTNALKFAREICDKDGIHYEGIAASVKCAKPLFNSFFEDCGDSTLDEEKLRKFATSLHSEGIPGFAVYGQDQIECVEGLHTFVCSSRKVETRCGEDAMRALAPLVRATMDYVTRTCDDEVKNRLLDIIRVMKPEEEQEEKN